MAMFNSRKPVTRLDLNSQGQPSPTPMGGTGGGTSKQDAISQYSPYSQGSGETLTSIGKSVGDAYSDAGKKYIDAWKTGIRAGETPSGGSTGITFGGDYNVPWFTDNSPQTKIVDGKLVPSTYGTDPSEFGQSKPTSTGSSRSGGSGGSSGGGGGGSSGGGGVVYSGASAIPTFNAAGLAKMEEMISDIESSWEDVKKMQAADKQAGLDEMRQRIADYTNSPVFQSARAASQQLMSGELTGTQKAQIAALEKGFARKYGQAALARGFGGSEQAASRIAGVQGDIAAEASGMVRDNLVQGIQTGGALESAYQGGLTGMSETIATEIYPTQYNMPDTGQYLETIGRAYSQAGAGTGAKKSGTWRQVGKEDITKPGQGLRWEYISAEQLAKEQEARDAGYPSLFQYELAQQREAERERLRAKARAKGKNI